ncbi:hypothetical protein A616_17175 [Brevibacillus brevis X23]|nr:hypothetical protein A616_17175 [Brevibacillus brevis X23]
MNLKNAVFNKFRAMLPDTIGDKAVNKVVDECIDRLQNLLKEDPHVLLEDVITIKINSGYYEGDIQLIDSREYGYSWIFDKETGCLHTS